MKRTVSVRPYNRVLCIFQLFKFRKNCTKTNRIYSAIQTKMIVEPEYFTAVIDYFSAFWYNAISYISIIGRIMPK